ncbi:MAG: hypothetical protein U0M06_14655 [Clostridia bacterium]|nr:hypothetical protein [Clostridia bacterium]
MNNDGINADALQNVIGKLMANPDALKNILSVIGSTNQEAAVINNEQDKESEGSENNLENEDESAPVSASVSIPPEILAKLPGIISALGGIGGTSDQEKGKGQAKKKGCSEREALLCALKPYLSPHRAKALDKIIQLSRLGDILGSI